MEAVQKAELPLLQEQPRKVRISSFAGGINTDVDPTQLGEGQSPDLLNLLVVQGVLRVDTGLSQFGTGMIDGMPQGVFQMEHPDGTLSTVLVTTTTQYWLSSEGAWMPPSGQWFVQEDYTNTALIQVTSGTQSLYANQTFAVQLSDGSTLNTTITLTQMNLISRQLVPAGRTIPAGATLIGTNWVFAVDYPAGSNNFIVDQSSSSMALTTDQIYQVSLDDGSLFTFNALAADYVLTLSPPIPAGVTLQGGAQINVSIVLHGDLTKQVFAVSYAPYDYMVITNGVDPPFVFFKNSFSLLAVNYTFEQAPVCQNLAVFHESLLLIGMIVDGDLSAPAGVIPPLQTPGAHRRRIRMSDAGNPNGWVPGKDGIAAVYDLVDTDDELLCAYPLGQWLILYRSKSVMRATYLGLLDQILFWEYMIVGEGAYSAGSVVPVTVVNTNDTFHMLLGNYNFYRYRGDYRLEPIGQAIWLEHFGPSGLVNKAAQPLAHAVYNPMWGEVWWALALAPSALPNHILRFRLQNGAWFHRTFPISSVSFDPYLSAVGAQAIPTILLSAETSIMAYDFESVEDVGIPIKWSVTTRDFGEGNVYNRYTHILVFGLGVDVLVEYSIDHGRTWQVIGAGNFGESAPSLIFMTLGLQGTGFVSEYMRVRFSGVDPNFRIIHMEVWYEAETEWGMGGSFIAGVSLVGGADSPI